MLRGEHAGKHCLFTPTQFKNMTMEERGRWELARISSPVREFVGFDKDGNPRYQD